MKKLCQIPEDYLQTVLVKLLKNAGYNKVQYLKDKFIVAEGTLPICLIAHLDTVFMSLPAEFLYDYKQKILWSPYGSGFDDRAGVYGILQCIESDLRPHIIFTCGEEKGGIGAKEVTKFFPFCPFVDCRGLIELDRANHRDSVFYDCDNKDYENWINSFGFKTTWGSFSDISVIAPTWKIAAVNLSIGYMDEHSVAERLNCDWCDETIEKVKKILKESPNMLAYEYVPIKYNTKYWTKAYGYEGIYGSPQEEDDEDFYSYEDIDLNRMNRCLLCDRTLNEENRHIIPDEKYPYCVCEDCFNSYYDANSVYQGGWTDRRRETD